MGGRRGYKLARVERTLLGARGREELPMGAGWARDGR